MWETYLRGKRGHQGGQLAVRRARRVRREPSERARLRLVGIHEHGRLPRKRQPARAARGGLHARRVLLVDPRGVPASSARGRRRNVGRRRQRDCPCAEKCRRATLQRRVARLAATHGGSGQRQSASASATKFVRTSVGDGAKVPHTVGGRSRGPQRSSPRRLTAGSWHPHGGLSCLRLWLNEPQCRDSGGICLSRKVGGYLPNVEKQLLFRTSATFLPWHGTGPGSVVIRSRQKKSCGPTSAAYPRFRFQIPV